MTTPDSQVANDGWSDLRRIRQVPHIDFDRLHTYRLNRVREQLRLAEAAMCLLLSPVSLRYAADYRTYGLFQSHIPTTYLFVAAEGPTVIHGVYGKPPMVDDVRAARPLSFFDGGYNLTEAADALSHDIVRYLSDIGTSNRRVAIEYVNPSLTQALLRRGLEVVDGAVIAEAARIIKSPDEIACMRWAISVAEHGIHKMRQSIRPGVTELQLWGLINYTNLANDGDWHDGRMLASGPRINPWLQEATPRLVESGDLVGVDTDMVGPFGYFADISRTFHCGPSLPSKRQKELYRLAVKEIEHNLSLIRPGMTLQEFQARAYVQAVDFHSNAYTCLIHGAGMADEYPRVNPSFGSPSHYDRALEAGMVICVESYVGAVGERDGVKLEQQVLIVENGYEILSTYPLDDKLLD